jgi:hypothetical protein
MKSTKPMPAFCDGCEYAGSIPPGEPLVSGTSYEEPASEHTGVVFFDGEMRQSVAIVDSGNLNAGKKEEAIVDVGTTVYQCRRKGGVCGLEKAGYMPVEMEPFQRKHMLESKIARLEGVVEFGD